jgi:DedD protein
VERHVKERLIGAAVLVAAAVILIPEMLSGPKRPATAAAPARAGEVPMKTYTIDLNHSPGAAPSNPPTVSEQVPPAEEVTSSAAPIDSPSTAVTSPAPAAEVAASPPKETSVARDDSEVKTSPAASQTIPESAPIKPAPTPTPAPPPVKDSVAKAPAVKESAAKESIAKEPPRPAPVAQTATKPLAPAATAPTSRQWAVQLGSFSSEAGAERLAKEWTERGVKAFVMPVKTGSKTLYRVRLGPFAERPAADDALRKVGNRIAGAAVVAHP